MFDDDTFYILKPDNARKSTSDLSATYNRLTEPPAILAALLVMFGVVSGKEYPILSNEFSNGYRNAWFTVVLLSVTFVTGARIIQSLYLAKRDYTRLEFGMRDIVVFFAFAFFTTGGAFLAFGDQLLVIVAVYAVLCLIAVWNFLNLRNVRIPSDARHYDIPIERRIQTVNAIVFFLLFLEFITSAVLLWVGNLISELWLCVTLIPIIPLMIFNMIHSHQLSAWPKLLVSNKHLMPSKIVERLDAVLGGAKMITEEINLEDIVKEYKNLFKVIVIRRAKRSDIELISRLYLQYFGDVISSIGDVEVSERKDIFDRLVGNGFGLGALGYLRFYIIEIDGKRAGAIMPEFRVDPRIYNRLGYLSLGYFLIRKFGAFRANSVYKAIRLLRKLEPRPDLKELRVNYLMFSDDYQRRGNGVRVVSLLKNAFIGSSTNGFRAATISAYAREQNTASVRLFEKCGFAKHDVSGEEIEANDPLRSNGVLVKFSFPAEN